MGDPLEVGGWPPVSGGVAPGAPDGPLLTPGGSTVGVARSTAGATVIVGVSRPEGGAPRLGRATAFAGPLDPLGAGDVTNRTRFTPRNSTRVARTVVPARNATNRGLLCSGRRRGGVHLRAAV